MIRAVLTVWSRAVGIRRPVRSYLGRKRLNPPSSPKGPAPTYQSTRATSATAQPLEQPLARPLGQHPGLLLPRELANLFDGSVDVWVCEALIGSPCTAHDSPPT